MSALNEKNFINEFVAAFPGDHSFNNLPRQTPKVCYSLVQPTPVKNPQLIGWSSELANDLNISLPTEKDIHLLSGNLVLPSMKPYAACYAGHQFGHWAGQLGDGRAITLGELKLSENSILELQLKGAGLTPYSRTADGRAVLRSSLREFLMSEAMFHLGVPTTRALSLVATGEMVVRDQFYDGNPKEEQGAIVARVSPSFLRFGNFEILAARKEVESLKMLADWTIERFYPESKQAANPYLFFFESVMNKTAKLMVEWMRVGFVHGVMNTDNMSILGLTIDYGPYSFLDEFDLNFTPNTTDLPGRRYAFGNQPSIAQWNLGCFAGALMPLIGDSKPLVALLESFSDLYWDLYYEMMVSKLGFDQLKGEEDNRFINEWNQFLQLLKPDMAIFYSLLKSSILEKVEDELAFFQPCFYQELTQEQASSFKLMLMKYRNRMASNSCSIDEAWAKMKRSNPEFVLRNYLLQEAIEQLENGDDAAFKKLQAAIKNPYDCADIYFTQKRPEIYNNKAGSSMLSCSS